MEGGLLGAIEARIVAGRSAAPLRPAADDRERARRPASRIGDVNAQGERRGEDPNAASART
jgi:hypothetical protein